MLLSSSITDEEQRHGFMWLGLESSLWNVMTNHVKPETHTSVSLKENQMLLQIIDCKTEQYIIPLSFLPASHGARLWQDYKTKDNYVNDLCHIFWKCLILPLCFILFIYSRRFTRKLSNGWKRVKSNYYWGKILISYKIWLFDLHMNTYFTYIVFMLVIMFIVVIDKTNEIPQILSYIKHFMVEAWYQ